MHDAAKLWASSAPLMLSRIRPEKNERRFYALALTADLFGNVVLMRHWGRIGTGGKQREDLFSDFSSAAESLGRLARKKRRRGYVEYGICLVSLPPAGRPLANPVTSPP